MCSDKLLHNNLSALEKVDPPLATQLLDHEVDPTWKILRTKEGALAACKSLGEDRPIHTNSLADPIREAKEWHANITKRSETLVVLGFGLGYHAIPLLETESGFESIIMVEASVDLFALALSCRDLTPILTNPRIRILVGENTEHLHRSLTRNCKPPFQYTRFLPVIETDRAYYDMVCHMLEEILFDHRSKSPTDDPLRIGVGQFLDYLTT
jgi:hypothetical protein